MINQPAIITGGFGRKTHAATPVNGEGEVQGGFCLSAGLRSVLAAPARIGRLTVYRPDKCYPIRGAAALCEFMSAVSECVKNCIGLGTPGWRVRPG
jgi:hypothetical protein